MKKQNNLLKSARIERCWTPEFVSGKVGVSLSTYTRWEAGRQRPYPSSLSALCQVFEMSAVELGFAHLADLGQGMPGAEQIEKQIDTSPFTVSDNAQASAETLAQWAAGIADCWQQYMAGSQVELEHTAPTYLVSLGQPTLSPGPDQKMAAGLTSQVYQLIALLDLQRGDFATAEANGTQALVYSQLSKDWNMYVAAQIRLATIFSARKRIGSALGAYNDALRRVNAGIDSISPLLHSWIFAGLAEIQATMGREQEAVQFLKLAFAVFPIKPEEDTCFSYTQYDLTMLFLYEGMVFLRLGQPKHAWDAFTRIDEQKPTPPARLRAEFLKHRTYTSLVLGNMIQSCIYLEAAVKAAQLISSDLTLSEIYVLYEHMLAIWGQESRVRALAKLFQKG
jgi:transcriptional regulator with XRE-family HTH domain